MKPYWWLYKGFEVRRNQAGREKVFLEGYPQDLETIASEHPTPLYLINGDRILKNIEMVRRAFEKAYAGRVAVHFAVKECHVPQVLSLIFRTGCGIDAASPNEARLGLKMGVPAEDIIHTSPSISDADLKLLAGLGVRINLDSFSQARRLVRLFRNGELSAAPALAVRINPLVGAGGDRYSITGGTVTAEGVPIKFGVDAETAAKIVGYARRNGMVVDTLHFHIGSGWFDPQQAFRQALQRVAELYRNLTRSGHTMRRIDVGGGAGVRAREDQDCFPWERYAGVIDECLRECSVNPEILMLEPGDGLVLDAGVLLTRANSVEEKNGVTHVYLDSGMGSFPAVRLYQEWHEIINVSRPYAARKEYAVDGNCCETGDSFTYNRLRPIEEVREGDVLAILDATGFSEQSCNYCLWGRAHLLLREGRRLTPCTRGVESLEDILGRFLVDPAAGATGCGPSEGSQPP